MRLGPRSQRVCAARAVLTEAQLSYVLTEALLSYVQEVEVINQLNSDLRLPLVTRALSLFAYCPAA